MSATLCVPEPASRSSPTAARPARRRPAITRYVGVLAVVALVLPCLAWVLLDHTVWEWDPAWYGEVSVDLYYTLRVNPGQWPEAMKHAIGSKAPGLTWLGQFFVPLGKRLGSVDFALLLFILLTQACTLLLVWKLGRELCPRQSLLAPLAGCLMVAAAPLFVALSHAYMVEPLQGLAIAWIFTTAACARRWPRLLVAGNLLAATAVALLAKAGTPPYCLFAGLLALVRLALPRQDAARPTRLATAAHLACVLAGAALLLATWWWYRANVSHVLEHIRQSSVGEVALDYGRRDTFPRKLAAWLSWACANLTTPVSAWAFTALGCAAAVAWLVRWRRLGFRAAYGPGDALALAALLQVVLVFAVMALSISESLRFLFPLLPSFAVLFLWALAQLRARWVAAVVCVIVLAQWLDVHSIALGLSRPRYTDWLTVPERASGAEEEVTRLVASTGGASTWDHYNLVGVEMSWLNANTLSFYAAKQRLWTGGRAFYAGLGYGEADAGRALRRIDTLKAVHFITLDRSALRHAPEFVNRASAPVAERISHDPRFAPEPFPSTRGVLVFRRVERAK